MESFRARVASSYTCLGPEQEVIERLNPLQWISSAHVWPDLGPLAGGVGVVCKLE
jgi:hypothetical protein